MISTEILESISVYVSSKSDVCEAGGILVGGYRGPHIEIVSCTTPLPRDIRKRHLFDRRDPGHQSAALKAWLTSSKTETFVGEWHTHPEAYPSPSQRDLVTWHGIMNRTPATLVFLIVGWQAIWCATGHRGRLSNASTL
ncbi:Mov34/MPN/PAD-1 family protein [Mesorhizobium sp.]|uniref:Mov34/MPN/PAD-1 family protein n=1 Tax=Mesorhizobium sp. TaxID=1871066 RepID=UPI00344CBBA3